MSSVLPPPIPHSTLQFNISIVSSGGSVHPPDNLPRCPLYQSEAQPPCVIKPLSDIEKVSLPLSLPPFIIPSLSEAS